MPRPRITTFGYRQPRSRRTSSGFTTPTTPGPLERELAGRRRPTYGRPLTPDYDPAGRYTQPEFTPPRAATPAAPATTPEEKPPPAKTDTGQPGYDSDPILQKIKALHGFVDAQGRFVPGRRIEDARAEAAAARKQLAVDVGLDEPELFGEDIARAARENPLSVLAGITREGERERVDLNEALNQANLFFGGHRGLRLGELEQQVLGRRAEAGRQARGILGDINRALSGAEEASIQAALDAEAEAYARAVEQAKTSGGGGDAGGGGSGGDETIPTGNRLIDELVRTAREKEGQGVTDVELEQALPGFTPAPTAPPTAVDVLEEILLGKRRRGGGFFRAL